jgi:hypothetical protein
VCKRIKVRKESADAVEVHKVKKRDQQVKTEPQGSLTFKNTGRGGIVKRD